MTDVDSWGRGGGGGGGDGINIGNWAGEKEERRNKTDMRDVWLAVPCELSLLPSRPSFLLIRSNMLK